MVNSALATQRGFRADVRHRSTASVTWLSRGASDAKQFVVFRLTPSAWKSPSRCRVSLYPARRQVKGTPTSGEPRLKVPALLAGL